MLLPPLPLDPAALAAPAAVGGTMVAHLLPLAIEAAGTEWRSEPAPAGASFVEFLRHARRTARPPEKWNEILELDKFKEWSRTRIVDGAPLCEQLGAAARDLPDAGGCYVRRDWSKKKVYVLGDVHGSLHSLCDVLLAAHAAGDMDADGALRFEAAFVCTGDVLDYSPYALDCLYVVLRLLRANAGNGRVVLLAGNHEGEPAQWDTNRGVAHEMRGEYGTRCGWFGDMRRRLLAVTKKLPVSLVARTAVGLLQFSHGAFERGLATGRGKHVPFADFVAFEDGTAGPYWASDVDSILWSDVAIAASGDNGRGKGHLFSSRQTDVYLQKYGFRLLVRGHSDQANLSLQMREGSQPSEALQSEGRRPADSGTKPPYFGIRGWPLPDNGEFANVFKRGALDITEDEPEYDLFTLVQATDSPAFTKTLISPTEPSPDLLSVTLASCAFAKSLPPINSMTCFAVIEPARGAPVSKP